MMKAFVAGVLVAVGCGSVQDRPPIDAASVPDRPPIDAAFEEDGRTVDAPIDAPVDAPDLSPRLIFVTGSTFDCALGGVAGGDAKCQAAAAAVGLPGTYKVWLADATGSPATRMTHHAGPYRLVTTAVVAQSWDDLTDGTLMNKIDRTESGLQLGGVGCNASDPVRCHFICEGGEVWSNVSASGGRRMGANDCAGWTGGANATAGNSDKVDAAWTVGICTNIGSGSLPIFCVQQ